MPSRVIRRVVLAAAAVLLVPFVAMQVTDEVDWGVGDFIIGGALLCGAGLTHELLARRGITVAYRAAVGVAVGGALLLAWIGIAVGLP